MFIKLDELCNWQTAKPVRKFSRDAQEGREIISSSLMEVAFSHFTTIQR